MIFARMTLATFPWTLLVASIILLFALLIKHLFEGVIEDEHTFLGIIGIFLLCYIAAAVAIGTLDPLRLLPTEVSASPELTIIDRSPF